MTSSPAASGTWHSVTPATRPLSLTILELTPLALTLSLTLASPLSLAPATPSAAARKRRTGTRGHTHTHHRRDSDNDAETEHEDVEGNNHVAIPGSWPLDVGRSFKDLLSHGVVVSVNGQPWNRIVAHVSDPDPEPEHVEHEGEESTSDTEGTGTGQEGEWEEGEWDHAGARSDEEGAGAELGRGGVQRRRPRRARFMLSAQDAIGAKNVRKVRRERHAEERDRDRAVVVVYGLTPGKEYEVELRVIGVGAQDGEVVLSNSILIPPSPAGGARSRANSLRSRSNPRSRSNSTNAPPADILMPDGSSAAGTLTPGSAGLTPPVYPPEHLLGGTTITPTPVLSAADTQAAQMRHLVASAHAEKEHLSVQIKEARRASQRAEAALRQEIESVKRAIEKAGSLDMRARQKTLALQEQVKQGWAGAEGAEESAQSVEGGMADLEAQLRAVTLELQAVQEELESVREREEEIRERDRRSRAEEEKKLADVQARLDKQRKARDKKASERQELEKRLESVQREQEETEKRFEEMRKRAAMQPQHPGQYPYGNNNASNHHGMAWDPWEAHAHAQHASHTNHRLANHPSMPNIGAGAAFRPRGSAYQPRFASGGSRPIVNTANTAQVGPAQSSPTHPAGFAVAPNHPARSAANAAVKATTSPALSNRIPSGANVPTLATASATVSAATSNAGTGSTASPAHNQSNLPGAPIINPSASPAVGGSSSGGTNPSAAPFMPSTASPSMGNAVPTIARTASPALGAASPNAAGSTTSPSMSTKAGADYVYDPSHHTTLMPPSLQHRIYFSSNHAQSSGSSGPTAGQGQSQNASHNQAVRPRPSPNFHPPPSVLAEQAQRAQEAGTGVARKGSISNPNAGPGVSLSNTPPLPGSPSFPPLPSTSGNTSRAGSGDDAAQTLASGVRSTSPLSAPGSATSASPAPSQTPQGPSLASIITRAVLQPGSGVLNNTNHQTMGGRRTASPPYAHGLHMPYGQGQDARPGIMSRRSSATAPAASAFGAAAQLDQQLAQHAQQAQHAQHAAHAQIQGGASTAGAGPKVSFGPSAIQSAILARGSNVLNLAPAANAAAGSRAASANSMAGAGGSSSGNSRSGSASGDAEFPPLSPMGPGGAVGQAGVGQHPHGLHAHGQGQGAHGHGHAQQGPSVGPWSALNLGGPGH